MWRIGMVFLAITGTALASARAQSEPMTLVGPGSVIGVMVRELTPEEVASLMSALLTNDAAGMYIAAVRPGAAAEQAGLRVGDVVVAIDGEQAGGRRSFDRLVRQTPPGRAVSVVFVRAGLRRSATVTPMHDDHVEWTPSSADLLRR